MRAAPMQAGAAPPAWNATALINGGDYGSLASQDATSALLSDQRQASAAGKARPRSAASTSTADCGAYAAVQLPPLLEQVPSGDSSAMSIDMPAASPTAAAAGAAMLFSPRPPPQRRPGRGCASPRQHWVRQGTPPAAATTPTTQALSAADNAPAAAAAGVDAAAVPGAGNLCVRRALLQSGASGDDGSTINTTGPGLLPAADGGATTFLALHMLPPLVLVGEGAEGSARSSGTAPSQPASPWAFSPCSPQHWPAPPKEQRPVCASPAPKQRARMSLDACGAHGGAAAAALVAALSARGSTPEGTHTLELLPPPSLGGNNATAPAWPVQPWAHQLQQQPAGGAACRQPPGLSVCVQDVGASPRPLYCTSPLPPSGPLPPLRSPSCKARAWHVLGLPGCTSPLAPQPVSPSS